MYIIETIDKNKTSTLEIIIPLLWKTIIAYIYDK